MEGVCSPPRVLRMQTNRTVRYAAAHTIQRDRPIPATATQRGILGVVAHGSTPDGSQLVPTRHTLVIEYTCAFLGAEVG
jgi:hypothetical protein